MKENLNEMGHSTLPPFECTVTMDSTMHLPSPPLSLPLPSRLPPPFPPLPLFPPPLLPPPLLPPTLLPPTLQEFHLEFYFSENEWFSNPILTKTYKMACEVEEDDPFSFEGAAITSCEG